MIHIHAENNSDGNSAVGTEQTVTIEDDERTIHLRRYALYR